MARAGFEQLALSVLHKLAIVAMIVFIVGPIYVIFLVAVTPVATELSGNPQWLPHVTLANFSAIFTNWRGFVTNVQSTSVADLVLPGLRNSLLVAAPVALANVIVAAPAGYAFARLRFLGRRTIGLGILGTQMLPALVMVLPLFVLFQHLGLTDSLLGVGIADMSLTLRFAIWIVANAVGDVPLELERASRVDGLTRVGSIVRITLPLARSGLITAGLFSFMLAWNDIIYPLILVVSPNLIMIQPAIAGMYNNLYSDFGVMMAAVVVAMVPTMVIAVATLRPLVRGMLSGAVKG